MEVHFSQILHFLGLEMIFWDDFPMILHGFAPRNKQKHVKINKNYDFYIKFGPGPKNTQQNKKTCQSTA